MKKRKLALIGASVLAGVFLTSGMLLAQRDRGERAERPVEPRQVSPRGALLEQEKALVSLFENAAPSVAYLTTETRVRRGFFGEQVGVEQGAGSGFVWDSRGHVVTNHHVVANIVAGRDKVLVQLDNGKEPIAAEVVGTSPVYDLAGL